MHIHICGITGIGIETTMVAIDEDGEDKTPKAQYSLAFVGADHTHISVGEFTKTQLMRGLNDCLTQLMEDTPIQGEAAKPDSGQPH